MERHETHNPDQTVALGRQFAQRLSVGDCVALEGQLGAGKTQFVRGVALGLGLDDGRMVCSPTFVLVREYAARVPVYHLDVYRLSDAETELADLGFDEMLADGVVLLEWAERVRPLLPKGAWRVNIEITGQIDRVFSISRSQ
ncbi:MAG: tRNA (adenosine(37)-N6)-threonylcarbamoyltransferase complex ATPase subunit type 1 TsaE [Planctomycetes bacterium]|nr:tRNA (adenosine(37)-N6)-threonylcarbamoyltransferase complex ATPase subunit type 1 TsaE [Planctomycetota bacterium]